MQKYFFITIKFTFWFIYRVLPVAKYFNKFLVKGPEWAVYNLPRCSPVIAKVVKGL